MTSPSVATRARLLLRSASLVFWDFDGVIKETVAIKGVEFERLFQPFGAAVASRVRRHHEEHGGMSRFEKIPLYLEWAGESPTEARVAEFCDRFGGAVFQAVIDAEWVPGVREYLQAHHVEQPFVLITATPQAEIEQIVRAIGIEACFAKISGAPTPKEDAIRAGLQALRCQPGRAFVVGDSQADWDAARATDVPFLLRATQLNESLRVRHDGPMFENLRDG